MRPDTPIEKVLRMQDAQKTALAKMGVATVRDLLYFFPSRYAHIGEIKNITDLKAGDTTIVYGRVLSAKTSKAYRKKIPIGEAVVEDKTGKLRVVWFHQAYAAKMISNGDMVKLAGTVQEDKRGTLYLANPEFEKTKELPIDVGDSLFAGEKSAVFAYPIYSESKGITSRFLYHAIQKILKSGILDTLEDPVPSKILKTYNLPSLKTALVWIHTPKKNSDAEVARKRFAFEEIFFIQLERQRARRAYQAHGAFTVPQKNDDVQKFLSRFPFTPTEAQTRAIATITEDFGREKPMLRLLEGDVGSGKTLVAAATAYSIVAPYLRAPAFSSSASSAPSHPRHPRLLQVAYMAPTEILAQQHFDSFISYFSHLPIQIALITGSGCKKFPSKVSPDKPTDISRAQLLKWVANGEISILIGTHALIEKSVKFKDLAYVVIDEQHKFGTTQRSKLVRKDNRVPHLLSMTATPIPRTLALTIYGDLDLALLDEMPAGRKRVATEIVLPDGREKTYDAVRAELKAGRQAYVICPRINEPDPEKETALRVKSVKEEAKRLQEKIFPKYEIGVLHGKMTPKEKECVMNEFAAGNINILVATSVVEVGVNIPNATIIIIEGAERFGLAQLHQLRGRVLRSAHQAYCYLFADTKTSTSLKRLKALVEAKNGFELAELDLSLRGAGELSGAKQWGISDIGMEAIKNIKMVEAARTEAQKLLDTDPDLSHFPLISARISSKHTAVHFE